MTRYMGSNFLIPLLLAINNLTTDFLFPKMLYALFILCYTLTMQNDRTFWPAWERMLSRWGLKEPVAAVLEAAGPLTILLAQAVYLTQPLAGSMRPGGQWQAVAQMLEDQKEGHNFAAYLREENTR